MATLYKVSGEVITVSPANGYRFTLEELQDYIGGYINIIRYSGICIVCDEDGYPRQLEVNKAFRLAYPLFVQTLVGPVMACAKEEVGY